MTKHALSGACAGVVFTNISFPFDLMKVKKQANIELQGISYRQEIKLIYRKEGLAGFTRGYSGMIVRDVPGFAIYFGSFEAFKTML